MLGYFGGYVLFICSFLHSFLTPCFVCLHSLLALALPFTTLHYVHVIAVKSEANERNRCEDISRMKKDKLKRM